MCKWLEPHPLFCKIWLEINKMCVCVSKIVPTVSSCTVFEIWQLITRLTNTLAGWKISSHQCCRFLYLTHSDCYWDRIDIQSSTVMWIIWYFEFFTSFFHRYWNIWNSEKIGLNFRYSLFITKLSIIKPKEDIFIYDTLAR